MTTEAEIKLVNQARLGDRDAFDKLVERYKGLVYGFAYHSVRNYDDARDVTQNVFVSVYLNLSRLDETAKFNAWLRRITSNACHAFVRDRTEIESINPMLMAPDRVSPMLTRLAVEQALSCLSDQTRLTITLFYFGSYSLIEIGSFLDIPVSTVKSRLRDGRNRLKKEMIDMVESTVNEERLGPEFNAAVAALAEASIRGNTDKAREMLTANSLLVTGLGGVAEEHVEHMRSANADHGWTPLHLAAHYGNLDIVRLLIEHGADVEAVAQNGIGNTPISAAAWGDHLDIVAYLLDHGANVNAPNSWGATALHRAVDANRKPLVELLLSHGADPSIQDNSGKTPIDVAREEGKIDLVEMLKLRRERANRSN